MNTIKQFFQRMHATLNRYYTYRLLWRGRHEIVVIVITLFSLRMADTTTWDMDSRMAFIALCWMQIGFHLSELLNWRRY